MSVAPDQMLQPGQPAAPATPAPDLTGLDQFKPPGFADLNANVSDAEAARARAQGNLDTQIADVPQPPAPETDSQPAPQRNIGSLMQMAPWLMILSVMGGRATKLSANNMLAATTGMINGLVSGDDQRYQEEYQKWQEQHKQFAELQKQKWDVYREMVKVYKDQIDGKEKALQVAETAVRDARKDRADSMSSYLQTVRASLALRDEARKWATLDEAVRSHKANEQQKATDEADKNARAKGKDSAKGQARADQLAQANKLIDDISASLNKQQTSGGLGVTGVGGMVRRGLETVGNVTGLSQDTTAHRFESQLSDLQLIVAPLLASSRTAKDQREKIEKVVRGLKPGDTVQNTRQALSDLKKQLNALQPAEEQSPHGKVIRSGKQGDRRVVQYEDGTVDYAD